MLRIFDYTIAPNDTGMSIEDYLTTLGYSHAVLVHLKKTHRSVLADGVWTHMNAPLKAGSHLHITLLESEGSPGILASEQPISICYEDADILVVDKPAGMPVHPSRRHPDDTLANAVCGYYSRQGIPYTFRCVNRIDRDTTGLVILAKHMLSSALLNQAAAARTIHREYLAIADGMVPACGTIDAPIARKGDSIEREVDFVRGERAVTHYRRLAYHDGLSLVSLVLETGRTHQIRVHMKYLGYPLIGDTLYHPDDTAGDERCQDLFVRKIKRQALHSCRLRFTHPITGLSMDLSAPLPADMAALMQEAPSPHTGSAP